ncbi:hypothetical protein [Cellulomonas soli]
MMPAAPPVPSSTPPGAGTSFQAPPGWQVPSGFDPRRGHLVDPAWPAAPEGWQFWAPTPRPGGFLGWVKRAGWGPILLGSLLLLIAIALVTTGGDTSDTGTGVGSCWSADSPTSQFHTVDCASDAAQYEVISEVGSVQECADPQGPYFEVGSLVQCLREVG